MRGVRAAVKAAVSGFPAAFWWLWIATLISSMGGFVVPFLAIWLTTEHDFSATVVGLVGTAFGLGSVAGAVLGGVGADRLGRKITLLIAQLVAAAAVLALGFVDRLPVIAALVFLVGLGTNATRPARSAAMADLVPAGDRVRAFSLNFWAVNLGFAIAPPMAGFLANVDYLTLFVGNAVALLAMAVVVQLRVPETRPTTEPEHTRTTPKPRLSDVLSDRPFLIFVGLTFVVALIYLQMNTTVPIAMADSGRTTEEYGLVIGINGLLIVLLQLPLNHATRRLPRPLILAVAVLLLGTGFAATGLVDAVWAYALTVGVWTLGEILHAPTSMSVVAELSPDEMRGRYQGVYSLAWSGAALVAPLGGGWVYDELGPGTLWAACGVLGVLAAIGHLAAGRARGEAIALRKPQPVATASTTAGSSESSATT